MKRPDLIIFGGAFDPPHKGHFDCVSLTLKHFPEAELWIVPALKPAGAAGQHKTTVLDFDQRLKLCEFTFQKLLKTHKRLSIKDIEKTLPPPNLTLNTLQEIKKRDHHKEIALLVGQDQLSSFSKWHKPLEILKNASMIVVSRRYHDKEQTHTLLEDALSLTKELNISINWLESSLHGEFKDLGHDLYLIDETLSAAASKHIRSYLQSGKALPESWLSEDQKGFLKQHGFYQKKGQKT